MLRPGADLKGARGLQPPYSWRINRNMERVKEKKRWRKEEKRKERGRRRDQPPSIMFCIRHWPQPRH